MWGYAVPWRRSVAAAELRWLVIGLVAGLSLTVAGLSLTACGGSAAPHHAHASAASRGRGRADFRWLVAIRGAPPSVAAENRRPGTRAWRLPGPAADVGGRAHGSVSGYVSRPTVRPGQTERIYVSAPGARRIRIAVFRIGWYRGRGGREVLRTGWLAARFQPPCNHSFRSGVTRCRWHATLSFVIPPALPSGVYIAKLSTPRAARDCLFVVRSLRPAPLLVQIPTATYEAYNAWGGDSLYPGGVLRVAVTETNQGHAVSYARPYDSLTGAGQFFARDVAMVRFLERYGYPVSYTSSESVDAEPAQVLGHRAVLDIGHSEYWSARQRRAFARALQTGTSLLFFSSDLLAEPVRFAHPTGAGDAPTIIAEGGAAAGAGGLARGDRFRRLSAALTGSAYLGCITPRLPGTGPPTYRYYGWSPAPTLQPGWLFRHTGMRRDSTLPGIVGYELDARTPASPPGAQVIGGGSAPCMAPTRTDPGEALLGTGAGEAQTTLYTARSGAIVFNTGTLGWELGLQPVPSASPSAPRRPERQLVALTRNLLAYVLHRR